MSDDPTHLTAARRSRELAELPGREFDMAVIGGGITGVGAALDAASRGLKVVLVERDDLASGTSSKSSRVIHGGTRYLARGGVGPAVESAGERNLLLRRIAPHLVRPLPMLIPEMTGQPNRLRRLTRAGLRVGDIVRRISGTDSDSLPSPRRVSGAEAQGLFPGLRQDELAAAMLSFDTQLEDDVRLVVAVARTAAEYGATILTRVSARRFGGGTVDCTDELTGEAFTIRARTVVNATGVWAGELESTLRTEVRKGAHVLVPGALLGEPRTALAIPVAANPEEVVYAIPQSDGNVLIGVTDGVASGLDDDEVTAEEVSWLLGTINRALDAALTEDDVVGRFAGVRPILPNDKDSDLEKRHAIVITDSGDVTVVGGKLTTYRRMAEDAVDRVIAANLMWAGECQTRDLPLVGAASARRLDEIDADERLVRRYGTEAPEVEALAAERPELAERVVPELPVLRAELAWALERELAMTAEDLIDRRTRIGQTKYREQGLEVARRMLDMAARPQR